MDKYRVRMLSKDLKFFKPRLIVETVNAFSEATAKNQMIAKYNNHFVVSVKKVQELNG